MSHNNDLKLQQHNAIVFRTEKKCNKCSKMKFLDDFHKFKYSVDGHLGKCKICLNDERNCDEYRASRKEIRKKNKVKNNETQRIWYHKNVKVNPVLRLRKATSKAVRCGLLRNNGSKHGESTFKHLPYTVEQLKTHLESLWESWMNWDNYGKYDLNKMTWQIDHIVPQSRLLFSNMNEDNFKILWDLSNLRPLETIANMRKSNK